MRKPTKYIKLNAADKEKINEVYRNHPTHRVRQRAHAILLSASGYSIKELTSIFGVERHTIGQWLTSFESDGVAGLEEGERSGRPRKISEEQEDKLKKVAEENPQMAVVAAIIVLCIDVSLATVRRAFARLKLKWKRHRRSLKKLRNVSEFQKSKKELKEFQELAKNREIELLYFDESGVSQKPEVPFGWQPIGTTVELPPCSSHNKRLNILGAVNYVTGDLKSYIFESKVDSEVVQYVLTEIVKDINRKTIIVIDNASFHTSDETTDLIEELESKYPVSFYFLPPYSPELNLIEIVWKRIKHKGLQISSYLDFETLYSSLTQILANYSSSNWKVTFA